MDRWLSQVRLLDGRLVDVQISAGVITAIHPAGTTTPHGHIQAGEGRTIIPGLWDAHVHFGQWATLSRYVPAGHVRSIAQLAALAAESTPEPGRPLVLAGARPALFERLPTAADLDHLPTPVAVISSDAHSVLLNQAGLNLLGYAGHPTGFLLEHDAFAAQVALGRAPDRLKDAWVMDAARAAAARGVVGIVDLEFGWNLDDWLRREAAGNTVLKVMAGFYPEHLDQAIAAGRASGEAVSALVHLGPLKIISDGSIGSLTAWTSRPYPDGGHGQPNYSPAELRALVRRAASAHLATTIHAIGDEAVRVALDTFAEVGVAGTIEHAQQVSNADLPRFAALNVTASIQPEHAMDDRDLVERYWTGTSSDSYRIRSLLHAGAHVTFGSDAPVTPLDPWFAISSAATRTREPERGPWQDDEAVTLAQALAASTRSDIAVGAPADLVVLDANLEAGANLEPKHLRAMPVAVTLLGGEITYDGAGLG